MVLVITHQQAEALLSMQEAITAVEQAFAERARGNVIAPLRPLVPLAEYEGSLLVMPAYVGGSIDAFAVKIVAVYPKNPAKHGLPTVAATIQVSDPRTGLPLAYLEGAYVTAVRTGAVSGVATKYLARKTARRVAVFGAGVQARTQLMAVRAVVPVEAVVVYDPVQKAAQAYAREMEQQLGVRVQVASNPSDAVRGADIIVTATTSPTPVFDADLVAEGTHVNAIGAFTPTTRELGSNLIRRAKLVVDSVEAALTEAGDILIPIREGVIGKEHIYAELGEMVLGRKPGRTSDADITVFKSVGLALQDVAVATQLYRKALEQGVGTEIPL